MFINTQGAAMSLGFPDICKVPTPAGPIPAPFPNIALSSSAIPSQVKTFVTCMPMHNMATITPITNGDTAGVAGGLVSQMIMGPAKHMRSSFKVFASCMPVTRMLDQTGQNGMVPNSVGTTLSPAQVKVMVLA